MVHIHNISAVYMQYSMYSEKPEWTALQLQIIYENLNYKLFTKMYYTHFITISNDSVVSENHACDTQQAFEAH